MIPRLHIVIHLYNVMDCMSHRLTHQNNTLDFLYVRTLHGFIWPVCAFHSNQDSSSSTPHKNEKWGPELIHKEYMMPSNLKTTG